MSVVGAPFVRLATQPDDVHIREHQAASVEESQKYRGSLQQLPLNDNSTVFVSGFGNTVMGSISVDIEGNNAHIRHVYVDPRAREVGLADAMLSTVLAYVRSAGVAHIEAQALPGDRAMKNLFERHGLIAQTIIVGKLL